MKNSQKNHTAVHRPYAGWGGLSFKAIALVLFVLGVICASPIGQVIYVAGMISVIGIPVALLMVAIPNIALVVVISFLLWRFIPAFGRWGVGAAFGGGICLLFMIPLHHNVMLKLHAHHLTADDLNTFDNAEHRDLASAPGNSLGIVLTDRRRICSALCLHLLVSEQASSVIIGSVEKNAIAPEMTARSVSYRLVGPANCPQSAISGAGVRASRTTAATNPGSIAARYFEKIDDGYCVSIEETTLAKADTVVMMVRPRDFPDPVRLSPIAAKFSASRSAIYRQDPAGVPALVWRQTAVDYSFLGPVLFYTVNVPAGLSGTRGQWWRKKIASQTPSFSNMRALIQYAGYTLPEKLI